LVFFKVHNHLLQQNPISIFNQANDILP